jgi:hypothetical protein
MSDPMASPGGTPQPGAPAQPAAASAGPDPDPAASPADATSDASATPAGRARSTDPRVDDALSRLAEVDQLPLAEQVEVFGDIHRRLAAVLADPDSQAQ